MKKYTRKDCDYSFKGLEKTFLEVLESISLEYIRDMQGILGDSSIHIIKASCLI